MPPVMWTKNRGRNGWDPPLEVDRDQSVESRNITLYNGGLGTKRGGSTRCTFSTSVQGPINKLIEFIPAQDVTAAELFIIDSAAPIKVFRSTTGAAAALTNNALTLVDAIASAPQDVSAVTLNGKEFFAYDSAVNRLHVFDPDFSTTILRRAGMGLPAAPTGADMGAGGLSLSRSYKVAFTRQIGGVTYGRSELSAVLTRSITAKLGSTITKPATISEDETHWELYAADPATGTYYLMATTAVGTTTYDDTAATIDTSADAEPIVGQNTPWPSVKYLGTDGKRLVGFGVYESAAGDSVTPKNGRFYFGPVLDSSELVYDDERINNSLDVQGFLDVARNSGAEDRGVTTKPVNNVFYAFQSQGVYGFVPTESVNIPYRRIVIDTTIGAVNNQSIVLATDKRGRACVYFLDPVLGPYTVGGPNGLAWCGKDVKDVWDTVNHDAATLVAWGLWYPDRNQVMFWIATGSSDDPDTLLVLDVTEQYVDEDGDLRGGWTIWTGDFADARCGTLFSNTGALPRSTVKMPYVGLNDSSEKLLRYDEAEEDDDGTTFQAYVTSGLLAQDIANIELQRAYLAASGEPGVSIQQTLTKNFGEDAVPPSTTLLTPENGETFVLKKFEDATLAEAWALQVTLGDAAAAASSWQLYQWRAELLSGALR